MKIIVDAMGGDNAPQAIVQGALDAHKLHGVDIILVGRAAEVLRAVEACGEKDLPVGVEIKHAKEVVEVADDPAMVNRIRGIRRAAMGPLVPTATGRAVLCDCGANAQCTAEYLLQFAYLGSFYAQRVCGVEKPRVGLLNIGAEEEKGDDLRHEAFALLQEAAVQGRINFIGNVESNEALMGAADVLVADGFTGNIMLKTMEGTAKFLLKELKRAMTASTKNKLAAGMLKGDLMQMKKMLTRPKWGVPPSWALPVRSSRPTAPPTPGPSPTRCCGPRSMRKAVSSRTFRPTSNTCGSSPAWKKIDFLLTPP